ncbi:MAG: zinc-binding dehydrogenase [Ktedonobacteraceae bacterium]|nr:zinc-binding dehydrogenase [Ktedonobacteraceae bacterium]
MHIVQARQFGPPEVLQIEKTEEPQAGPGQVIIDVKAAGVGFGDTLIRSGKYPFPLPFVPGWEVGGLITKVGPGGDRSLIGRPVVARLTSGGGYAQQVAVDAAAFLHIPPGLSIEQAIGVYLAGQTAASLLKTVPIIGGEVVLITAAAGSVGSLLVQLAKAAGAGTVIGAARGKEKLNAVSRLGADIAIDYGEDGWVEQVREVTGGKGADVVIDSVGGAIGQQALELTASGHGRLAMFGASSGSGITIETLTLARRGVTVIGALGMMLAMTEQQTRANAEFVLAEAAAGRLTAVIGQTYPLERAAEAHTALEARQTIGKVLLIP